MGVEADGGTSRAAAPKPAFLRELEALRQQRERPSQDRDYTIGGTVEQCVHREVNEQRETRIRTLETRFRGMRAHATNEFGVSQRLGAATRDFERAFKALRDYDRER